MKKQFFLLFCSCFVFAQQEPEDIAIVTDTFQEAFFESLAQKGIENHDRAIEYLEKCLVLEPENPAVYQELGKNYQAQRNYEKAFAAYEKAFELNERNLWPLVGLYDVCYESKNYTKAIDIVKKLINFKKEYKEELCALYMTTRQFDQALNLINELNNEIGKSDMREHYKAQILREPKYQAVERVNLQEQIAKNPKDESNYIALIRLYSEIDQEDKALDVARKLEKAIPTSEWAHVNLFTSHLTVDEPEKALKSLEVVFASRKIDNKIKHRMLNEFLIYAKERPQYDAQLAQALLFFTSERDIQIAREVGKFFHQKNMFDRALYFYELQLKQTPDDFETKSLQMEVFANSNAVEKMAGEAEKLIELYPLEPKYYLYAGQSNNTINNYKKAQEWLEAGLDYIVDNPQLEADFYYELSKAYRGLGDIKKADNFREKAQKIKK